MDLVKIYPCLVQTRLDERKSGKIPIWDVSISIGVGVSWGEPEQEAHGPRESPGWELGYQNRAGGHQSAI